MTDRQFKGLQIMMAVHTILILVALFAVDVALSGKLQCNRVYGGYRFKGRRSE